MCRTPSAWLLLPLQNVMTNLFSASNFLFQAIDSTLGCFEPRLRDRFPRQGVPYLLSVIYSFLSKYLDLLLRVGGEGETSYAISSLFWSRFTSYVSLALSAISICSLISSSLLTGVSVNAWESFNVILPKTLVDGAVPVQNLIESTDRTTLLVENGLKLRKAIG